MKLFKHRCVLFLAIFWSICCTSQDYQRVDEVIKLYPETFEDPKELSFFISRDFISEDEKVRAIFSWIISNIRYEPSEYNKFDYSFTNYRERNQKDEELRKKIILRTLQTGKAVCEGYAMLFEKLCELQGIQSYLVRGDVKSNFDDVGRPFKKIHMWNVAIINNHPYLFDPTWGAGKWNGSFKKDADYFYFKTSPEQFIKTHFPDMVEDAFVNDASLDRNWFANIPLIIDKSVLYGDIKTPKDGVIETANYFNEIPFIIKGAAPNVISVANESFQTEIPFTIDNGILNFSVPITGKKQQLLIYFNNKPALAYKIE